MSKLNWGRPVHRRAGKQTEDRGRHPGIMAPLVRSREPQARQERARAAKASARITEPTPVLVAEWPHSRSGDTLRVYFHEFQGRSYIHARRFHADESGELKPGKGLGVHVDNLPALARAFAEAVLKARELGLIDQVPR